MVTVKMLEPYHIKTEKEKIRIILAYRYFAIQFDHKIYHFIPLEAREIVINRKTKKIINKHDRFAFQSGEEIIYVEMQELIYLPDFLIQLHFIVESYDAQKKLEHDETLIEDIDAMMEKLVHENIKRAIDKALDERDEKAFNHLVQLFNDDHEYEPF